MTGFDQPPRRYRPQYGVPVRTPSSWAARSAAQQRKARLDKLRFWGLIALVAAVLGGGAVVLGDARQPDPKQIVWIAEKTTSAPSGVPEQLRRRLADLVARGPVELTTYAIGQTAQRVGAIDLHVVREDGQLETDERLREQGLRRRLEAVREVVNETSVGDEGLSLYAALQAIEIEADANPHPLEVWLSATVLTGSVAPLAVAELTVTDPKPAVEQLRRPLAAVDLRGVDLHPVLLTPVGAEQKPLTPASDAWRAGFIRLLPGSLGATVAEPLYDASTAEPWAKASVTPPIEPIATPTPTFPQPVPGKAAVHVFDTLLFEPDQDRLVDRNATLARIDQILLHYRPGMRFEVTGYCAAFGDPATARTLAARRAAVIGELLTSRNVPKGAIQTEGRGFDERANPNEHPQSAAQRVVLVKLLPAG